MTPLEMLTDLVMGFAADVDGLVILEVSRKQWRTLHVHLTDTGRVRATDISEVVALGCELRPPTRGRGAMPIPSDFGLAVAKRIAAVTGKRLFCQVFGSDCFEGWVDP